MDAFYVFCGHGSSWAFEPYVAVFSSLEALVAHYNAMDPDEGVGGSFFIEVQYPDHPERTVQIHSGAARHHKTLSVEDLATRLAAVVP